MQLTFQPAGISEQQNEEDEHLITQMRLLLKCGEQVSSNDGIHFQLRHAVWNVKKAGNTDYRDTERVWESKACSLIERAEGCRWALCGFNGKRDTADSRLVRMWYLVLLFFFFVFLFLVFLGGSGEFKSLELGACITISRGRAVALSNALWEALRGAATVYRWVTEWV